MSNLMLTRWQLFITLSVLLSPSHLDEQCFCYEGKIQQRQPTTEQNNIKILTPDLTIFVIDTAETTTSNKIVVHFTVQFHFPVSWKSFHHLFSPEFILFCFVFFFPFLRLHRPQHLHNIEFGDQGYQRINISTGYKWNRTRLPTEKHNFLKVSQLCYPL